MNSDVLTMLGPEVVSKMLAALTMTDDGEDNRDSHHRDIPDRDKQMWTIKKNVDSLSFEGRLTIGNIINMHGKKSELKETNDGLMIVLDNLNDSIIEQIYIFITYKTII